MLRSQENAGLHSRPSLALFHAINSRLTGRGIPVSWTDIYGALSEFIGTCISQDAVTLLDINNSVPEDLYNEDIKDKFNYDLNETFMGFTATPTQEAGIL